MHRRSFLRGMLAAPLIIPASRLDFGVPRLHRPASVVVSDSVVDFTDLPPGIQRITLDISGAVTFDSGTISVVYG